jgi:hypothetical protein
MGNAESLFDLNQRRHIQAAEIQLVPVDMSTVQGMLDAAQVIGDALSESTECEQDARAMSNEYRNAVNNIVRSVADTNGGNLAMRNASGGSLLTSYNSPPVRSYRFTNTYGYIATDSDWGVEYTGSIVDTSRVMLFGNYSTWKSTPLSFWMQAAGVFDRTAGTVAFKRGGLLAFWPLQDGSRRTGATMSGGHGTLSRWLGSSDGVGGGADSSWMIGQELSIGELLGSNYGLGSYQVPYLIVCARTETSARVVKNDVISSMLSFSDYNSLTPYSLLPSPSHYPSVTIGDKNFSSTIGGNLNGVNPFYMRDLDPEDVVRENPIGLLGSWTEGNMESVLEAVWLADIYSRSPAGCDYVPITNMGNFSVTISGQRCTTTRDAVIQFYHTFYRADASGVYGAIVTDEGV